MKKVNTRSRGNSKATSRSAALEARARLEREQEEEILSLLRKEADAFVPNVYPSAKKKAGLLAPIETREELSLTDLLVRNKFATFFVRADGDSMVDAGIWDGDLLVVDRSVEPRSGDIVMAYLHGDFTIKTLRFEAGRPVLHPENAEADYPVIRPTEYDDFRVEGVVMWNLRRQRR